MNKGDSGLLTLNIKINGEAIQDGDAKNIEIVFSSSCGLVTKTLKDGGIIWYPANEPGATGVYKVQLKQEDTFKMSAGNNQWQIRVLMQDGNVISSRPGIFNLGDSLSNGVLSA